jgi:hypothetical protein
MPDRPTADEQLDALIDRGVRSLVERNAPPGHAHQIRTRLAGGRRWLRPAVATAALLAAVGAGVWARWESIDDVLETRVVRQAPLQAPLVAPPALDPGSAARKNVAALRPLPSPSRLSPERDEARAAREAEASRAKLMAYLETLHQLPPEVLLREPPPAGELLPEPASIVIPEIVITPLSARMESEDDALSDDFSPRGEE